MKTLVIDSNRMRTSWGARNLVREATRLTENTVVVRRAPEGDLPARIEAFDAVILSGSLTSCMDQSEWVLKLDSLIRRFIDRGTPMLGVCYGHQSIIRALGGVKLLGESALPEVGWTKIERLDLASAQTESPLLEGLPREFWTFSNHHEEALALPQGLRLLARSERCGIQAFQHERAPVFGIQFHPEKDLESCEATFRDSHAKKKPGASLLRPKDGKKLYDATVAEKIFGNFLALAKARAKSGASA